jgi:hypothetical protein
LNAAAQSGYAEHVGEWSQSLLAAARSLGQAVLELLRGLPASFWPRPCKRRQAWQSKTRSLSSNTAAYNQARHRLPLSVVEHCRDRIFEQLMAQTAGLLPALGRRAFFFDGTSVQLASRPALRQN